MIKKLLFSCAVAAVAISANAEAKVLWQADNSDGYVVAKWDGDPILSLSAEAAKEIKAGDIIVVTVTGRAEDAKYTSVEINVPEVGKMVGAGTDQAYPYNAVLGVTDDIAEIIHEKGLSIKGGNDVYVSKIAYEKSSIEINANTIWFGPKACEYGNDVSIEARWFANLKAGDKLQLLYPAGDKNIVYGENGEPETNQWGIVRRADCQWIFGGWNGGCNIPSYERSIYPFIQNDPETGVMTYELEESLAGLVQGDNSYNLFELLSKQGLVIQGPIDIEQILLIPAPADDPTPDDPTAVSTIESVESSVIYNVFGQPVDDNYRGIVIKNGKKIMKK